ncbi:spore coat protein U domain-containing protein [Methylocystis sp. S23]
MHIIRPLQGRRAHTAFRRYGRRQHGQRDRVRLAQSAPVYGRIPPQTTPSSRVYADTIVVTLTF